MILELGQYMEELESEHVFGLIILGMIMLVVIVLSSISAYVKVTRYREQSALKARLIERGTPVDEIERILDAGLGADESNRKKQTGFGVNHLPDGGHA